MNSTTPKTNISVIIPVFNGAAYLEEAIESVLSQTFKPAEVLVMDDGSTDHSRDSVIRLIPAVRYLWQENRGTAAARNSGAELAFGNYLAFLDQDDLWESGKLEMQIDAFEKNKNLDIVFGQVQQFFSPELDEKVKSRHYCPSSPQPGYLPSLMLIKRDAFFRVGLFECQWQIGEWTNWFVRAKEADLNVEVLQQVLVKRRIHSKNKGILERNKRTEYARILKGSLDRRRSKGDLQY